jgi:cell division protease FtsH
VNDMSDTRKTPTGSGKDDGGGPTLRPMLWFWMCAIVLFMLFQSVTDVITSSPLAYSEFKQLLHGGKVNEVTLAETTVSGTLKSGGLDAILPKSRAESVKCDADGLCPFTPSA